MEEVVLSFVYGRSIGMAVVKVEEQIFCLC